LFYCRRQQLKPSRDHPGPKEPQEFLDLSGTREVLVPQELPVFVDNPEIPDPLVIKDRRETLDLKDQEVSLGLKGQQARLVSLALPVDPVLLAALDHEVLVLILPDPPDLPVLLVLQDLQVNRGKMVKVAFLDLRVH